MCLKNRKKMLYKIEFFFIYVTVSKRFISMFNFIFFNRRMSPDISRQILKKLDRIVLWYIVYHNKYRNIDKALDASMLKVARIIKPTTIERLHFHIFNNHT